MKRILCFGDSLTWGYMPCECVNNSAMNRFPADVRWTGVMAKLLGDEYAVIEEGLNGRRTIYEGTDGAIKNAVHYLAPCLMTASPINLVIVMLGSNDIKPEFGINEENMTDGIREMIRIIQENPDCGEGNKLPKILVVAPPHICKPDRFTDSYDKRGKEYGVHLAELFAPSYAAVAEEMGCEFIDSSLYTTPSTLDGLHIDAESHKKLGVAMAKKVEEIFA